MDNKQFKNKDVPLRKAVLDTLEALSTIDDFEKAAKLIFDQCKLLTGATAGYVALLAPNGSENEVLFLDAGGRECTVDENLPMPIRGLREISYREVKVVYDNNFHESEWVKFMPQGHVRMDNVMFAPLIMGKTVAGIIGLANKQGNFDEEDASIAETFGHIAAVELFKARKREKQKEVEEKVRIIEKILTKKSSGEDLSNEISDLKNELKNMLKKLET